MGTLLLWLLGGVAAVVAALFVIGSPFWLGGRISLWQRRYAAKLRAESIASLRARITASDYWGLTATAPLRSNEAVKTFFERFDAEDYDAILGADDGQRLVGVFVEAERAVGYVGRPMILDYDGLFVPVLKELRRRKARGVRDPEA